MTQSRTGRGRRRDPGLEPRVLAAAMETYARTGWAAFSMDAVARTAGVGKSTLYLRWPDKEKLLLDALEVHSTPVVAEDTGSLRGDAVHLGTALMRYFLDPVGWVAVRVAVDMAAQTVAFPTFHERIAAMHRESADRMVARAVERGELDPDVPVEPLVEALYGAILLHALALTPADREEARKDPGAHALPLVEFVLGRAADRST